MLNRLGDIMATIRNAINNKSQDLTIDPGASGDSVLQFSINGTGEFRIGVDDDASDAFKISQGSALGTTDTFVMTAAGERTMPLQPAVLAYLASSDASVTGNGTTFTVGSTTALTEVYDQNNDFATTTFTAPIGGRYYIHLNVGMDDITAAMTDGYVEIITSNRTYTGGYCSPGASKSAYNICGFCLTTVADMDASDTVTTTVTLSNGAGDSALILGAAMIFTYLNVSLTC